MNSLHNPSLSSVNPYKTSTHDDPYSPSIPYNIDDPYNPSLPSDDTVNLSNPFSTPDSSPTPTEQKHSSSPQVTSQPVEFNQSNIAENIIQNLYTTNSLGSTKRLVVASNQPDAKRAVKNKKTEKELNKRKEFKTPNIIEHRNFFI